MAESKSHARVKKTLESSKELTKATLENVAKERDKILEIIKNDIVESRIDEKEAMLKALAELYNDNEVEAINALKLDEAQEKLKLSEEYESIVKKQLQMLQADERGKQALLNEISSIKQEQRKRSEALKTRKKALLIEKERSKRIAALPPPLPKSVKRLLKEQDKKEPDSLAGSNSFLPRELDPVEEEIDVFEDKENMHDEMYHEHRRQLQEEWDRKAKRRFNEAIRKDRLKQEHAQILKEIEDAEKINRRHMARNLTEPGSQVPCPLSDRLNHIEKQAVLEDAVEGIFRKPNTTKEHAIEDLEGYEDKWEAKYKRIDSNLEAKLIDCVPNFVKQNYSYLLQEEPSQQCGNRFAQLDDSAEDLNVAYIESPTDRISGSDKISAVISHLDQMTSESNELIERDFRPLLEAEILKADQPKLESFDKAVEADILKLPTEDKSTDVQEGMSSRNEVPFASRSTQADFMSSGVMAFKRRSRGSKYKPFLGDLSVPRVQTPTWVEPEPDVSNGSWSSSSYRSLKSRFGQPDICKLCDSPSCNLPLVEGGRSYHRDCIPMSKSIEKVKKDALERESIKKSAAYPRDDVLEGSKSIEPSQEDISSSASTSTDEKSKFLSFVQLIAQKYLKKQQEEFEEQASSAREDEIHPEETPERVISGDHVGNKESESKAFPPSDTVPKQLTSESSASKKSKIQPMETELQEGTITSAEKSLTKTDKPNQAQFVQRCHEILSEKLSNLFMEGDIESEAEMLSALKSTVTEEGKKKLTPGDFIYHELSTILEMDSALTNDMPSLQDLSKKTSRSSSLSSLTRKSGEFISPEEVDTTSASLVDTPVSEAAELAKNIQFVSEPSKSTAEPQTPLGLISGTLSSIQTPSPQVITGVPELAKNVRIVTKSSGKPPESSELLEPKTPISFVARIFTDTQTAVTEASPGRPFTVTEHLNTPSQATVMSDISTPSTLKTFGSSTLGSKDLLTPASQLSPQSRPSESVEVTPYSSSHRFTNLKYPYLTNLTDDLPYYFKDVSSIQHENQESEDRQTVPKTVHSLTTSKQLFFPNNFDGKFQTDEDSASSFKPMTPRSYVSSSGSIPTEPDNKSTEGSSSSSFKPMMPHSYVSSRDALYSEPDNKSKNGNVHQKEHNLSKYNNQATGSSQGSFKPMKQHSYLPSEGAIYTEPDNKSKDSHPRELNLPKSANGPLHSTENSRIGYKPMTLRFYMPSPIEMPDQTDGHDAFANRDFSNRKVSSSEKGSDLQRTDSSNFQPMTPHTHTPSHFSLQDKGAHKTQSPTKRAPRDITESESSESEVSTPRTISPSQKIRDWIASPSDAMTPHYRISSPNYQSHGLVPESKDKPHDAKVWTSAKSSVNDYQPMTPHCYLSAPNLNSLVIDQSPEKKSYQHRILSPLQNEQYPSGNSNGGFQPMATHTYQSTPNLPSQTQQLADEENNGQRPVATESNEFQPVWTSAKSSVNDYQPMTPQCYLSAPNLNSLGIDQSPEKKSNQHRILSPLQNENPSGNSNGSFQPMSTHTYQSTPNLSSQTQQLPDEENNVQRPVATENNEFQPMMPHSYVPSSLSSEENPRSCSVNLRLRIPHNLISGSSQETTRTQDCQNEISSSRSNKSLTLSFGAKGQDYQNPDADVQYVTVGEGSHLQRICIKKKGFDKSSTIGNGLRNEVFEHGIKDVHSEQNAKKVPRSDFFIPLLSSADMAIAKSTQKNPKDSKKNTGLRNEIVEYLMKDTSNGKKAVKVPRSDIFVPLLSTADLAIEQKLQEVQKSMAHTKASSSGFLIAQPTPDVPRTHKGYFSSDISEVSSIRSSDLRTCTVSTPSISSLTSSSKSSINTKKLFRIGTDSSIGGCGSLSSLGSETPNFSVDSPNPILEALRKKFTSDSSSKASSLYSSPFSTQGTLSDNSVSKINSRSAPIKTIEDIIHETGIMDEPDLTLVTTNLTIKPGSPERTRLFSENHSLIKGLPTWSNKEVTEGMAITPSSAAGNSYADSPSLMSFLQHERSCHGESNSGGRQFDRNRPKYDYQKRTKRLWNNLEEVKSKKMEEEKQKKIAENRLKMKAYTRVYKKN